MRKPTNTRLFRVQFLWVKEFSGIQCDQCTGKLTSGYQDPRVRPNQRDTVRTQLPVLPSLPVP